MSLHDKQYISVGDIAALRRWRNGGEDEPRHRPQYHLGTFYGTRMEEPVVSRPSISLCALAASLSGYF